MLRLITGKAGTGKTAVIINEIKRAVDGRQGGRLLIVPEQYSHEAERELCLRCGDSLSLYGEVFSFTGLARRMAGRVGGSGKPYLDKGGRLLCMALALRGIGPRLKVYSAAGRRAELQDMLLRELDELKTAAIGSEQLLKASAQCEGSLADKLTDMALVLESYDAVVSRGHADPADRLTVLSAQIEKSEIDENTWVYVDGFTDFTRQEQEVLCALMKKGVQLTVCLTLDSMEGDNEIYELSRRSGRYLLRQAKELGIDSSIEQLDGEAGKSPASAFSTTICSAIPRRSLRGTGEPWSFSGLRACLPSASWRLPELWSWRGIKAAAGGIYPYWLGALRTTGVFWRVPSATMGCPCTLPGRVICCSGLWLLLSAVYLRYTGPAGLWTR